MISVFFSYSHRDEELRNELDIHLSPLKRQGVISTWHDRRIGPGQEFEHAISEALEIADIILLLVSPYFVASDYCHDVEMQRAMERHERGEARVIPVILHPCDWHSMPFGKLQAATEDGKPISKFTNLHDGFLQVVLSIRRAAEEIRQRRGLPQESVEIPAPTSLQAPVVRPQARSSNLRIKKTFSDRERDQFLEEAFEYIARYFENSLGELQDRNERIETRFRRIDANHFTAAIYTGGTRASECKIWMSERNSSAGDIAFSHQITSHDHGFNESLSVEDDGYTLFLSAMGMSFRAQAGAQLTLEGASEYLWDLLISSLQD